MTSAVIATHLQGHFLQQLCLVPKYTLEIISRQCNHGGGVSDASSVQSTENLLRRRYSHPEQCSLIGWSHALISLGKLLCACQPGLISTDAPLVEVQLGS